MRWEPEAFSQPPRRRVEPPLRHGEGTDIEMNEALTNNFGVPITPSARAHAIDDWATDQRNSWPRTVTTPAAAPACTSCSASATSRVKGFSHSTWQPAAIASGPRGRGWPEGPAMETASRLEGQGLAEMTCRRTCSTPNRSARRAAWAGSVPTRATTSKPAWRSAGIWMRAPKEVPTTQARRLNCSAAALPALPPPAA